MNQTRILDDFNALPAEAQELVAALVSLLSREYHLPQASHDIRTTGLTDDEFIGLWKDREDMLDSSQYIRLLRKNEWS